MTRLVNLKTFVILSFVSTMISACGVQPANTNQTGQNNDKNYGFTTLADTKTEAQIREEYLKAHATPAPTATPVKNAETPRPTAIPTPLKTEAPKPLPTPTPVKTAEVPRQFTPEEIKIREDYLKAHTTPVPTPVKTETPKPLPTPIKTESPKPLPTPTPVKTAEVPRQLTPEEIKIREDYLKAHSTPVPTPVKTETPKPLPTPIKTESPKPLPTPTPVKTAEVPRQLTPEEIKIREDYIKAHTAPAPTPTPVKTEAPKATVSLALKASISK